jgi:hypothetical protein
MAKVPVLEIAKANETLVGAENKDKALYSPLLLPKIYAVQKLVPNIPEGWTAGTNEYIHGMGYPPMYLYYQQQNYFRNFVEDIAFDPPRFIYGSQGMYPYMNSTKLFNDNGTALDSYLILFLDPLTTPAEAPVPTTHGSPRIKIGNDLVNSPDYLASIDSKYQTLKVHMQGQFVCNLPAWSATEVMGEDWTKDNWFEFNHDLGFPPVHTPFVNTVGLLVDLAYEGEIPLDFIVNDVNDLMAEKWVYEFGFGSTHTETLWIYVDTNKYYIGYRRQNWAFEAYDFPARTVRVNYTIFNLPINEEFNLLS